MVTTVACTLAGLLLIVVTCLVLFFPLRWIGRLVAHYILGAEHPSNTDISGGAIFGLLLMGVASFTVFFVLMWCHDLGEWLCQLL